ncbi:hypothetical protein HYV88_00005, partial [Candidatus Woesearchaeota archaeon]|nr:hypothetical protein [Candidatus Woesearchaeota archaeon]
MVLLLLFFIILILPFIGNNITGKVVEQVYNFGVPKIDKEIIATTDSTLSFGLENRSSTTTTIVRLEEKLFEGSTFFAQADSDFNDDFNRAANDNLGTNWTEVVGDIDINNNWMRTGAQNSNRNIALLNHSSFLGIHNSTQTVNCQDFDDRDQCGLIARYVNESNYYLLFNPSTYSYMNLTKVVDNVTTILNRTSFVIGGDMSLIVNGTNLSIYSQGVLKASVIDSDLQNDTSFIGTYLRDSNLGVGAIALDSYNISTSTAATTSSTTLPHANLTLYLTNSSFTGLYQNITAFTNASVNITSNDEYPADVNMTLFVTNYTGGKYNQNTSKSFLQNITTFWTNGSFLVNITWEGNTTFFGNSTAFYVDVVATTTSSSTTSTSSSTSSTTASSGTGSTGGEGGGGTRISETPAPVPLVRVLPPITEIPIPPTIIRPKPIGTTYDFYDRIKATKEEKTILKTLEEKIKVGAYPDKVSNILVIRFRNTLFIPIEDF